MDTTKVTPELFAALAASGCVYWLTHADYPGYFATLDGRVYSARKLRFLSPIRLGKYVGLQVIHRDHGPVKRYLHRLLLEFWTGVVPENMQACHNNGNRLDNRIDNLRWDTVSGNHADKVAHGTSNHGERNPSAKLSDQSVREIRRRVEAGESQRSLCDVFSVSPMAISRAVRGVTWRHV